MSDLLADFREVWLADFEFGSEPGGPPEVRCLVARELRSGRVFRFWADELANMPAAPFNTGPDALLVAYFASAEIGCFLTLGWKPPAYVLDLFAEFRCLTNGRPSAMGNGLLGAMAFFGLDGLAADEKDAFRELALRGGEYTTGERAALLDYCQEDVDALAQLLPRMLPSIDLPRAILRGRYMIAVASMEATGVPIDSATLGRLRDCWADLQGELIGRVDQDYGVYQGGKFSFERFGEYLVRQNIAWPRTEKGRLATDSDTFRQMAKSYPQLSALRELRHSLGEMRLFDLAVGRDGRNRCLLSPFRSKTGRNQPSNTRFIFGPSCWLRSLIKPAEGRAVAYVDWSQQEFGIGAALSDDANMLAAYKSGDPYLAFAKQAGAVPATATKQSHPGERERFKACVLAVQYGMGAESLAARINVPTITARRLLEQHRETYPKFWAWSDGAVTHAMTTNKLHTVFGWLIRLGGDVNPRSLANFPCQANGAEMLRLACCLLTEAGIQVCAPVHDAVLVEGPADGIGEVVISARRLMAEASRITLGGFELSTDAEIITWPNRYSDSRGRQMWETISDILNSSSVSAGYGQRYRNACLALPQDTSGASTLSY